MCLIKCVPHVQHDYFPSFSQSDHCFLASSLQLPSSLLKLSKVFNKVCAIQWFFLIQSIISMICGSAVYRCRCRCLNSLVEGNATELQIPSFQMLLLDAHIDDKLQHIVKVCCGNHWPVARDFHNNHKNYNFLNCDCFKKLLFPTNSLAKLLSDSLLLDSSNNSLLSDSSTNQSHSKL